MMNQKAVIKDGRKTIYDGYPLNVNWNSDNGLNVNQNWNPGNINGNVGASVEVVSKQKQKHFLIKMLLLTLSNHPTFFQFPGVIFRFGYIFSD